MYKTIRIVDDITDKILRLFFVLLLLISLWFIYDSYYVFNHSTADSVIGFKPTRDNPGTLGELSDDVVAWITIDETTLDYPIMQGEDNSVYLNKDPYGEYSLAGSIFLDSRNDPMFRDEYSLVYGHHMAGGYMFGCLDKFAEETYFNEHRTGLLTLVDGTMYEVRSFAFFYCDASDDEIFNISFEMDNDARIQWIKERSTFFEAPSNSHIVLFSTCTSPLSTNRTILAVEILGEVQGTN